MQSVCSVCLCSQCAASACAVRVYCLSVQSVRLLWEQHKDSVAYQAIVAQEFDRALATLSSEVMQHEAEVTPLPRPALPPPMGDHTRLLLCMMDSRSCCSLPCLYPCNRVPPTQM